MKLAAGIRGTTRVQRISLIAAIGLGALSATGCSYINPQSTTMHISPSDGVRTDLGKLELRNILVASNGKDEPGRVLGAVFNTSTSPITLTISGAAGSQTQLVVAPGVPSYLTGESDAAILDTVSATPGTMESLKLTQTGPGEQTLEFSVPVVDGTLEDYKHLVPTSTPTGTAVPTETASPSATATETSHS
ncbi:hypothetical protein ACQCSX_16730 [Pseudarthrobacter sp. P1]|uniref:hypothetical protein n=1 Tax=Pseudarthrobacter sp. P1 TaxID=3418418 RepID=UPI003CF97A59